MKTTQITIDNLKCHGCANTIRRELSKEENVHSVDINHDNSTVSISFEGEESRRDEFTRILKKLGYPEQGTGNTFDNVKSYVSCAIGRMDK